LMDHWRATLGERLIEISYAEIVEDQELSTRRLIERCRLPWSDECLRFHQSVGTVRTASQWQVRQPVYKSSLQRWRNYEAHLDRLREALRGEIPI
jgi:hypothetical protein